MQENEEITSGHYHYQNSSPDSDRYQEVKRFPYRMTGEEFIHLTSAQDRTLLRDALDAALISFLRDFRAIYLDGLGIIYPAQVKQSITRDISHSQSLVRNETMVSAQFEKCYDLIDLHREQFPRITEIAELNAYIYPRLPIQSQLRWNEDQLARLLRGLVRSIREEIVIDGSSSQLQSLGRFFALHNRQGESPEDWFAGSDIFLQSTFQEPIAVESGRIFPKPVLRDAWELIEAGLGKPLYQFELDVCEELSRVGYDCQSIQSEFDAQSLKLPVAIFKSPSTERKDEAVLVYCTEGMRHFSLQDSSAVGTELTFQLAIPQSQLEEPLPLWPARVLSLGWVLMMSARDRRISLGAGLSAEMPLVPHFDTGLTGIFATPFSPVQSTQLSVDGEFEYVNLIGITDDEIQVAERRGADQLSMLLQFRKHHQVTRPARSSVVSRTGLLSHS
jgi:hypothetical protein